VCVGSVVAQLPPFITFDMLPLLDYRPNDIAISVPCKSGTTWTMNMVHQLRSGGDANFTDIYWEVPWLEYLEYPGQPIKDLLSRWEHFPRPLRRAFKVHAAPPALPYLPQVKYIVVVRNGLDTIASFHPFLAGHNLNYLKMWGIEGMIHVWSEKMALEMLIADTPYSGANFMLGWWPHRHSENVFMIHYNDLKSDLPAVLRKMATFLEIEVAESRWPAIEEYCSFRWMQDHGIKFEIGEVLKDVPTVYGKRLKMLDHGTMVREGRHGAGATLNAETVEAFEAVTKSRLSPEQYNWYMNGGVLAPVDVTRAHVRAQKQEV